MLRNECLITAQALRRFSKTMTHETIAGRVPKHSCGRTEDIERQLLFGPFRLLPAQRLLLEGDRPIPMGSRALDILIALVENAGKLVTKEELMGKVWPQIYVEPANLTVNIAALRRALGDGRNGQRYLVNISGRGYRFVASVSCKNGECAAPDAVAANPIHNLSIPLRRPIGRDSVISSLAACLMQRRLITIVGTGGVGKTTVAHTIAADLIRSFNDGIHLIDLSTLTDFRLVTPTVAASLGVRGTRPLEEITSFLKCKKLMLVFDSCEHVIEGAATLALALLRDAPDVRVLATSREPLHVDGEHVHRLTPLDVPREGTEGLKAADALTFPAVQLFVERAAQSLGGFELRDAEAPAAAAICSMLEGIPLAIEFAAAQLCCSGMGGLACHLASQLEFFRSVECSRAQRHSSLRTTFDWSYNWLTEKERRVLRRVSIFPNVFSLETVIAVVPRSDGNSLEIRECLVNLVKKSLVLADVTGRTVRYSLHNIVRIYGLEKLRESGELDETRRTYEDLFEAASFHSHTASIVCKLGLAAAEPV
jgi:predicted ATPase/DNA-binding winged helix-turn-helix (wHTH) protein